MRSKIVKIAGFIFAIVFACGISTAATLSGRVTRVSDGDTVWVRLDNGNRVKIRVWGIDTPEKFSSRKLYREADRCSVPAGSVVELGKLASERARILLSGKRVMIETHGRGYYGRLLGRIFVDGKDFGLIIIRTGYACAYHRSAPPEYLRAEREAERERIGLWKIAPGLMRCLCR